ncbi:PQQ-dependent sugar dehydrogenase [Halobacteria archaeon AArc-dxtr1]|nr:PQQ-dependent sugar dehydrogenase [Halobacteria archaeon AArc-dxtr1]
MTEDTSSTEGRIRRLAQALGGASAIGLAGCLGDDGDDDPNDENGNGENGNGENGNGDDPLEIPVPDWHRDHDWVPDPGAATDWDNYEVRDLGHESSGELMEMDVDPEGRIWYIGKGADVNIHGDEVTEICYVDPDTEDHTVALELDVIVGSEELTGGNASELGGQGIAVDPSFAETGYVYVFYHPASDDLDFIDNPYNEDITTASQLISRFEMDGDGLDPDSEEVILEVPVQLETCCHYGGCLEFGPEGDLWISTGDESNNVGAPHRPEIDYSMTDERDGDVGGRPAAVSDAQRTSGNTADLRGKLLRITPSENGYEIPEGNLKAYWERETGESYAAEEFHPEIYVMGLRNPFNLHVDEHTGIPFVSDYGNDAPEWDFDLGTVGHATHHLFCKPGNAGYPFFKGYYPNRDYDFENDQPRQPFWFDNLRNRSPNNTGIEHIPDVTPALLWHPQSFASYEDAAAWADMPRPGETTWSELDAGGSADAGVAYRYSDEYGEGALDPYFEGKQFFMNPSNMDVIRYLTFNDDGSVEIEEFLPGNPIEAAYDMEVLPDGRVVFMGMYSGIHVVEYSP